MKRSYSTKQAFNRLYTGLNDYMTRGMVTLQKKGHDVIKIRGMVDIGLPVTPEIYTHGIQWSVI